MPLRLTLKPHEHVILGGAAIRNGASRAELLIENEVPVLREADILSPSRVRTPCERIYLALQLNYVDADRRQAHLECYRSMAAEVGEVAPSLQAPLAAVAERVEAGDYYRALKAAGHLVACERELIGHVS